MKSFARRMLFPVLGLSVGLSVGCLPFLLWLTICICILVLEIDADSRASQAYEEYRSVRDE